MGNKLKTNKAMAKRIKVTKNNKLAHKKAYVSHLLTNKGDAPSKSKGGKILHSSEEHKVRNLIPYKLR